MNSRCGVSWVCFYSCRRESTNNSSRMRVFNWSNRKTLVITQRWLRDAGTTHGNATKMPWSRSKAKNVLKVFRGNSQQSTTLRARDASRELFTWLRRATKRHKEAHKRVDPLVGVAIR